MPNCFKLTRKTNNEDVNLLVVDEELCKHFGVEVHEERYYKSWYDWIGLGLSTGHTFHEIRELIKMNSPDHPLIPVIDFLDENFTADGWYQP